jgi:hypothetical protein
MNIDEVRFRHEFVVPYLLEQHGACQDLAVPAHHVLEQTEFPRPEIKLSLTAPRCLMGKINLERSYAQHRASVDYLRCVRTCLWVACYTRGQPWSLDVSPLWLGLEPGRKTEPFPRLAYRVIQKV